MKDAVLRTYRYFWRVKDSDKVNVKIITDTMEGHDFFVGKLREEYGDFLVKLVREYCSTIELDLLCTSFVIVDSGVDVDKEGVNDDEKI